MDAAEETSPDKGEPPVGALKPSNGAFRYRGPGFLALSC